MALRTVFDTCVPKPEVLAGEGLDPDRFFAGTYPTDNLKVLVKEIVERLAGSEGATLIFKLIT